MKFLFFQQENKSPKSCNKSRNKSARVRGQDRKIPPAPGANQVHNLQNSTRSCFEERAKRQTPVLNIFKITEDLTNVSLPRILSCGSSRNLSSPTNERLGLKIA